MRTQTEGRKRWFTVLMGAFLLAAAVGLAASVHRYLLGTANASPSSPQDAWDIRRTTYFQHDAGPYLVNYADESSWRVRHTFQFRNTLDKPLELSPKFVSCGCVDYQVEPTVVPPGKAGRVTMTFDTRYRRGQRSEMVVLQSGRPDVDDLTFVLTVDVYPRILVVPFGRRIDRMVRDNRPFDVPMTLVTYSRIDPDRNEREATAGDKESLSADIASHARGTARLSIGRPAASRRGDVRRTEYPCVLHVDPSTTADLRPFDIDWRTADARFRTHVVLTRESLVAVRPGTLFFHGGAGATEAGETQVVLSSTLPFSITKIDGAVDGIKIRRSVGAGGEHGRRHEFIVSFEPDGAGSAPTPKTARHEAREVSIIFHTDLDECPQVVLRVWRLGS